MGGNAGGGKDGWMVFAFCYYVSLLSGIYAALHFMLSSRVAKGSLCQRVDKVLLGKMFRNGRSDR